PSKRFKVYRSRASELAKYYAGLYRGAFALNYILGAFALLLAASGILFPAQAWLFVALACALCVVVNSLYAARTSQTTAKAKEVRPWTERLKKCSAEFAGGYGSPIAAVLNYALLILLIFSLISGAFWPLTTLFRLIVALLELACVVAILINTWVANARGFQ